MTKIFLIFLVGILMSGCQVNSHKYAGLTAFNDLVRGNKGAGHDV